MLLDILFDTAVPQNPCAKDLDWPSLVVQFVGTVVSAVIAIWVFRRGKVNEERNELHRVEDLSMYLFHAIKGLNEPLQKQIKSLKEFSKQLDSKKDENYSPQIIVSLHSKSIRWNNYEDIFKVFVTNRAGSVVSKSDRLQKLHRDLDYLDSISDTVERHLELLLDKKEKFSDNYNASMASIGRLKDEIYIEYKAKNTATPDFKYPLFHTVDELMHAWSKIPDNLEHHIAKEKLLIPLQAYCRKAEFDDNALTLLTHINNCLLALANLDELRKFLKGSIDFHIDRLEEARTNLAELVIYLEP